jgi:hypothetical protein
MLFAVNKSSARVAAPAGARSAAVPRPLVGAGRPLAVVRSDADRLADKAKEGVRDAGKSVRSLCAWGAGAGTGGGRALCVCVWCTCCPSTPTCCSTRQTTLAQPPTARPHHLHPARPSPHTMAHHATAGQPRRRGRQGLAQGRRQQGAVQVGQRRQGRRQHARQGASCGVCGACGCGWCALMRAHVHVHMQYAQRVWHASDI